MSILNSIGNGFAAIGNGIRQYAPAFAEGAQNGGALGGLLGVVSQYRQNYPTRNPAQITLPGAAPSPAQIGNGVVGAVPGMQTELPALSNTGFSTIGARSPKPQNPSQNWGGY